MEDSGKSYALLSIVVIFFVLADECHSYGYISASILLHTRNLTNELICTSISSYYKLE